MNRYIAVLLVRSQIKTDGARPLFCEDIALVHAADDDAAVVEAERHGRESERSYRNGDGETVVTSFVQLVDVAPLLFDDLSTTTDLYSRHFRDIDSYRRFDPKLDGEPL